MSVELSVSSVAPLRLGRVLGSAGPGLADLLAWLRLVNLSKLGAVAVALRELWALPRDLSDTAQVRAWAEKALEVAVLVADATQGAWDDGAVAELRRLLTQSTVLDAVVELIGRALKRVHGGDSADWVKALGDDGTLTAAGLPPAVTAWLVQFVLDLLGRWLARGEAT